MSNTGWFRVSRRARFMGLKVSGGISELRIDFGPGYRLYFTKRGLLVIVLLAGGDKRTQQADIRRAIKIAKDWKE